MSARGHHAQRPPAVDALHAAFLALLPRLRLHARIYFRHVRCPVRREDAIAEAVALAWKWYVRLAHRGKDAGALVSALAGYAVRAVNSGRRLCGQEPAKDVLSPLAQRRHGFVIVPLPMHSTLLGNPFDEALHDNTQTPVPEQVSFRCDFPAWRRTRTDRDRRVIDPLMLGERTLDVARRFGLSPARVSQLRREFCGDWTAFCADVPEDPGRAAAAV